MLSILRFSAIACVLVFGSFHSFAQANTGGSLRGLVTDQTGAVVTNSKAVLTNTGTNSSYTASVTAQGEYSFSSIPPGDYVLTVQSPGFAGQRYEHITINLNEVKSLNVPLAVGSSAQTVEVSTENANIVTQETSVTGLFTEQQIKDLPLNGRDYQSLIYLSPGITRSASGTGQGSGMVAAGTRPTNNNFLIDGGDANDPVVPSGTVGASGSAISAVPLDALGEFTVISSNASAEFGRSSGAVVNVVTKSGTNQIHGTVWEFLRNTSTNTRGFFDTVGVKSPFKSNQFGFRFGAPIWKDHTFISAAYEGYRQRANFSAKLLTPSAATLNGITNPALKALFLATFPQIVSSDTFTSASRTYVSNLDGDTGFVRFDHQVTARNQAVLTGSILNSTSSPINAGLIPGTGTGSTGRPYHFTLSDTQLVSSHIVNLGRLTFQRQALSFIGEAPTAAQLASGTARTSGPFKGMAYSSGIGDANGIPTIASNNGLFTTVGTASNYPQGRVSNVIGAADAVTYEHGRHNFKFGGEFRRIQENGVFSNAIRPSIALDDSSVAKFQAGTVLSQLQYFYLTGSSERGFRQNEQGYFAQDSWRVTPRLTLEYGVRYELFSPFAESRNLLNNAYVLDSNNTPQACTPLPFGPGFTNVALVNPHDYGIKPYCADNNNFGPRVGFSADIFGKGKTVIGGAWGVFYDRTFDNVYGNSRFNAPQVAPITTNGSSLPIATPTYDGTQASGVISTTQVYTATTLDPHLRTPYTQHFNLTASQELDKNTSITVAYVGGVGTKLLATETPNFGASFPVSFRPSNAGVLTRSTADINAKIIRGPFSTFSHRTSNASSNFHSLEATVKRRLSYGLSGQLAYTWAHSMDNISDEIAGNTDSANPQSTLDNLLLPYLTPGNNCPAISAATRSATTITGDATYQAAMKCATGNATLTTVQAASAYVGGYTQFRPIGYNYGDSSFDVRQRLAVSVNYELPFGRGKAFASNTNGVVNQAIGGWHLGSIFDTQTGTPYIVLAGVDANRDGNTNDRALITQVSNRNPTLVKNFSNAVTGPTVSRFVCDTTTSPAVNATTFSRTCNAGNGTITFNQGFGIADPTRRMHRGSLREPSIFNWDAQLFKTFKVRELATMRFSADAFNVLNHANFGVLNNSITSATFGRATSQRSLGQTQSRQLQFALKAEF